MPFKQEKMQLLKCELGMIPMRKEPTDRSEMISQIIYGEHAALMDENEKWYMVRTQHDQYEGWVDKKQMVNAVGHQPTQIIRSLFAEIKKDTTKLMIPAGAFVDPTTDEVIVTSTHMASIEEKNRSTIEDTAMMFLGAPYLWGGRTFAGIDCSGLTQVVNRLHGKSIRRDAWQQAEEGEVVTFIEETQSGDLAFFDNAEGRIVHTGMIVRTKNNDIEIIHASGKVRRDALDHQGIFNRETGEYSHQLRIIKRI